jgi:hypothetical protein
MTDKTPSSGKASLLDHAGAAVAGAVIASAIWALSGLGAPAWETIAREAPPQWLPRVVVLLLVALVLISAWAWRLRQLSKEPSTRKLKFNDYGGFYVEPKTGLGVCTRCINDSPRRYVHLMNVGKARVCNACQQTYRSEPAAPNT